MSGKPISDSEREQIERLVALPDDRIDTSDIPEIAEENWADARRGEYFRPRKQPVTIRLDADVVAWFKAHSRDRGYQTEINRVLRRHVDDAEQSGRGSGAASRRRDGSLG